MKARPLPSHASFLGQSLSEDPDISLPQRPRLITGITPIPYGRKGIIFEGPRQPQLIGGASARTYLPAILEKLDGTRTIEQMLDEAEGADANKLRDTIALLFSCGLLTDGPAKSCEGEFVECAAYLERFVDVTRNNRDGAEALARLARTTIRIAGDGLAARLMRDYIAGSGARDVEYLEEAADARPDLMVALATGQESGCGRTLESSRERGIPAIYVRIARESAQIGPYFAPRHGPCFACYERLHRGLDGPAGDADIRIWTAYAALKVVHHVTRLEDVHIHNGFRRYISGSHGIEEQHCHLASFPDCPTCGTEGPAINPHSQEMLAWLFHNSISLPPKELSSNRSHQRHYLAQNIHETRRKGDLYYARRTLSLPLEPETVGENASGDAVKPTLSDLAAILQNAFGKVQPKDGSRRIAPTGGGLGSPRAHVVANRVSGLEQGCYHYCAERHALVKLRGSEVVREPLLAEVDADCVIVGTADFHRLLFKYYSFAYRIAYLDAGVALGIAADFARSRGLAAFRITGFDDRLLARTVRVPTKDNQNLVTFALSVGGISECVPGAWNPSGGHSAQMEDFATQGEDLLQNVIAASSATRSGEVVVSSALAGAPVSNLSRMVRTRRSLRHFSDKLISYRSSDKIIASCGGSMRTLWLDCVGEGRKESLGDGRQTVTVETMRRCLNQEGLAAAPAFLLFLGGLDEALGTSGARGYRELLITAGHSAWRAIMTAQVLGIAACPTAGLVSAGCSEHLRLDSYCEAPLFALALGYPPNGG